MPEVVKVNNYQIFFDLLAIPAISETSGENCVQNVKAHRRLR
jgi:hypothetical protein